MRSGTSYFNTTLLKRQLIRFWPLWAGYAVIWGYALPVRFLMRREWDYLGTSRERAMEFASEVPGLLPILGQFLAIVFGLAAAAAMFSYLYNSRSAGLMHALPIRREGLFLTNYVSGLIGLLGPNVLIWLLTLGAEAARGAADVRAASVWLAGQCALCFFYYSSAVFCAQFTGHIVALPVFYAVLNWICAVVSTLVEELCREFLHGFAGFSEWAREAVWWLTPVVRIASDVRWTQGEEGAALQGAWVLALYAGAGLVLAALALWVYRGRHVETAGDVVAVPLLRPVFKYGVALCSGLCFGTVLNTVFGAGDKGGLAVSLLLWTAVGYLAAEMLLKRTFRVWRSWKGLIAALALMGAAIALVGLDAAGFAARVPDAGQVKSVTVSAGSTAPYDSGGYFAKNDLTDPELIGRIVALHRALAEQPDEPDLRDAESGRLTSVSLEVSYELNGAGRLRRRYTSWVRQGTPQAEAASALLCDPGTARMAYGLDEIDPRKLTGFAVDNLMDAKGNFRESYDSAVLPDGGRKEARALYEAVCADFEAGTLGRRYLFDDQPERLSGTCWADLRLTWDDGEEEITVWDNGTPTKSTYRPTREVCVTLTPDAENTLAVLYQIGAIKQGELRLYGEERLDAPLPEKAD